MCFVYVLRRQTEGGEVVFWFGSKAASGDTVACLRVTVLKKLAGVCQSSRLSAVMSVRCVEPQNVVVSHQLEKKSEWIFVTHSHTHSLTIKWKRQNMKFRDVCEYMWICRDTEILTDVWSVTVAASWWCGD